MFYKMIYFSIHKFAFSNLRFSPFYEHFRQLREKYTFKLKIKYIMLISSLSSIWWCTYIWFFLKKTIPPTPLHWTIQNILLAPNPFHCFFAKSLWAGKKFLLHYIFIRLFATFYTFSFIQPLPYHCYTITLVQSTMYNVQCTLCIVFEIVYIVHTPCVQCALFYTVNNFILCVTQ